MGAYLQKEAVSGLTFPGVRGIQAGREFYVIMCDFATIVNIFKFDADSGIPPNMRSQRKLRDSRVPKIASYILDNPDNYVFSAITVSIDKSMSFKTPPGAGSDDSIGTLRIPSNARILVNDGQHRCAAIRAAYNDNEKIGTERIAVVAFEDRGLKRSQQMFADLNKHAVKPTRSLGLLYDHRDTFARFIVNLVNDVDIFYGRTELERTNLSNRSTKFVTLNGVADATRYLLKIKPTTKTISSEKQKLAVEFWNMVATNIPEWNLLAGGEIKAHELRRYYVHAHTNVLNALGLAGHVLVKRKDWRERMKKLQKIDWQKSGPMWKDNVVMDGKMLKHRLGIKRAANEILKSLGISESIEAGA